VLLGARVDGLFFFKDVGVVVGSCLGCGESWAECVGEQMEVSEFAAWRGPVTLKYVFSIKRGENEVTG